MENPQKITDSKAVISLLAELFPNCFSTKGPAKPLKIGVFQDLVTRLENDERISKTTLRSTLRHYTNSWRYLESLKENAHRVDLDGVEGDVKAERVKPSGLNAKVYEKMQSGLQKSEILDSLDVGLTKFSNIKESLRENGLIKEDSMEPTESVTQLKTMEDNVPASEVIEYEIDRSEVEDRLNGAEITKIYYPYYSKEDKVYDPILKQEVG